MGEFLSCSHIFYVLIDGCRVDRHLDIVSQYVEIAVPYLTTEIQNSQKRLFESSMNGPTPDVPIQDIFALYRRMKTMLEMYHAFCPQYVHCLSLTHGRTS